jgi:hypothetical protein
MRPSARPRRATSCPLQRACSTSSVEPRERWSELRRRCCRSRPPARPLAAAAASLSLALAGRRPRPSRWPKRGEGPSSQGLRQRIAAHLGRAGARRGRRAAPGGAAGPSHGGTARQDLDGAGVGGGRRRSAAPCVGSARARAVAPGRPLAGAGVLGFQRQDPASLRGLCCSLLVKARSLVGDVAAARGLIADRACSPRAPAGLRPVLRARRGHHGRSGGPDRDAADLLLEAAALAARQGQPGLQALLLHRALKCGRAAEVSAPLRELAERLDSPLVANLAVHAEAAAAMEGTAWTGEPASGGGGAADGGSGRGR